MSLYPATHEIAQPSVTRILMTTDTVGGVWTYSLELTRALASHGIEVVLATMGPRPNSRQRLDAAQIANLTLAESDFALEWTNDPWHSVAAASHWLRDLEERFEPDIVHLNGYSHAGLPWSVPVVVVAHSCVLSWWQAVKRSPAPPEWNRYRRHVKRGLQAADSVVAPTYAMADMLEYHYGRLPKLHVIYNAVDRTRFSRGKERPFIFAAGRLWDEAKNVELLTRAAKHLPWPVVLAGESRHPDGRVRTYDNVRLVGQLDPAQMQAMMSSCPIYALPARYEPFGLSALEGALSGCALVLGDLPTLREVWGATATYIDPENVDALSAAILVLVADPARRSELADAAFRRACTFTPGRMAEEYVKAYCQLILRSRCHRNNSKRPGVMSCAS